MRFLMAFSIASFIFYNTGIARGQTFEFKGLVLGSKVELDELRDKFALKCYGTSFNKQPSGHDCVGKTTLLGQEGKFRVSLNNEGQFVGMRIDIKVEVTKMEVLKDMRKELVQKFGRPKSQTHNTLTWSNEKGQVALFGNPMTTAWLEFRGGKSAPRERLSEKHMKDL